MLRHELTTELSAGQMVKLSVNGIICIWTGTGDGGATIAQPNEASPHYFGVSEKRQQARDAFASFTGTPIVQLVPLYAEDIDGVTAA